MSMARGSLDLSDHPLHWVDSKKNLLATLGHCNESIQVKEQLTAMVGWLKKLDRSRERNERGS